MSLNFQPMLAGKAPADLSKLNLPVLVSPKLDGIRCIIIDGKPMSRKLKPIPNAYVQKVLSDLPNGLDGELMLTLPGNFNEVQSAVMSEDGEPKFHYCVFDVDTVIASGVAAEYAGRLALATKLCGIVGQVNPRVEVVPHYKCDTLEEVLEYEREFLAQGFEGLMIRSMTGPYKYGRSTEREGHLLKLKRFADAEAEIIGIEELMHNDNEATVNELGLTKRSSAKEGKRPAGTLGALICRREDGVEFNIGAGFTEAERARLWNFPPSNVICPRGLNIVGATVKYKYQPDPANPSNAPRFPVYLGLRHEDDQ